MKAEELKKLVKLARERKKGKNLSGLK